MTERAGFFDNLKIKFKNGWEGLKSRLVNPRIIGEEIRAEMTVAKDIVREKAEAVKTTWDSLGNSVGERMKNAVLRAGETLRQKVEKVTAGFRDRWQDLQERYREQGIVGTVQGMAEEAVTAVILLPEEIKIKRYSRAVYEETRKTDAIINTYDKLEENKPAGWEERISTLNETIEHVSQKRLLFRERYHLSLKRLEELRESRAKLAEAKSSRASGRVVSAGSLLANTA